MGDQAAEGLLSPFLQRRRIMRALPLLRGRILDYGCGNGALYGRLPMQQRHSYLGFDLDADVIQTARDTFPGAGFTADTDDLVESFDSVVSLAVIEHVPSVPNYMNALASLLAAGGRIVITSPHPRIDRVHRLGGAVGIFSGEANEEHNEYVTAASVATYCERAGLELERAESFLLGANQLFVCRQAPRSPVAPAPPVPDRGL